MTPVGPRDPAPLPGVPSADEQAASDAAAARDYLERRAEAREVGYRAQPKAGEEEATPRRRHPLSSLGMGVIPWLARRLNLR